MRCEKVDSFANKISILLLSMQIIALSFHAHQYNIQG